MSGCSFRSSMFARPSVHLLYLVDKYFLESSMVSVRNDFGEGQFAFAFPTRFDFHIIVVFLVIFVFLTLCLCHEYNNSFIVDILDIQGRTETK